MITCPNCGAEIDNSVTKCPYCGYINIEGAEQKYLDDLDEIKDSLARVEEEPAKALKKGLSKGAKVVIITISILIALAAIYVAILLVELQNHPKEFLTAEEKAYASAYKVVAGEQLAEAFDNRDIAQMAQIFDRAYSEDRVSIWGVDHYEAGYAASCYMKLKEELPKLDQGKLSKKDAEAITYYCFYFYYRGYGTDGTVIFDTIRDKEILPIITDRLGYTIEDMESFRDKVTVPEGVVRSKIYSTVKKNYKNYK